jgi:hypothetical protein
MVDRLGKQDLTIPHLMRMQAHVSVGFILSSVEDPDPHHFGEAGSGSRIRIKVESRIQIRIKVKRWKP